MTTFRRVDALPPYAFAEVERLKLELRRGGADVVDLGFGNPDVPPPAVALSEIPPSTADTSARRPASPSFALACRYIRALL
jgi:alanine-synthesizing transaminase